MPNMISKSNHLHRNASVLQIIKAAITGAAPLYPLSPVTPWMPQNCLLQTVLWVWIWKVVGCPPFKIFFGWSMYTQPFFSALKKVSNPSFSAPSDVQHMPHRDVYIKCCAYIDVLMGLMFALANEMWTVIGEDLLAPYIKLELHHTSSNGTDIALKLRKEHYYITLYVMIRFLQHPNTEIFSGYHSSPILACKMHCLPEIDFV